MSILRKSIDQIGIEDIHDLINSRARETAELEFKGTLAVKKESGKPTGQDRWITHGDYVGDFAMYEIISEMIAFANAQGGTLILGLHETNTEPRFAVRLEPLPHCERLAKRILDAAESAVEPRLPTFIAKPIIIDDSSSGYIVLRTNKSASAPHRMSKSHKFYIRRGESKMKMTVSEIKSVTLEMARSGDTIADLASKAQIDGATRFKRHYSTSTLYLQITAIPLIQQRISNLTLKPELWWRGKEFDYSVSDLKRRCEYPAREFSNDPRIEMRALTLPISDSQSLYRSINDQGIVNFGLLENDDDKKFPGFYLSWIVGLAVGVIAQVDHLRKKMAWETLEYGLFLNFYSAENSVKLLVDRYNDRSPTIIMDGTELLNLPSYSLQLLPEDYDRVLTEIVRDLWNAAGAHWSPNISLNWSSLS